MPEPEEALDPRQPRPGVSRLPAFVLLLGLGAALTLVILGASLAAAPAPAPDVSRPGTPESPRSVNVIMRDYRFDPTPIYLVSGETLRIFVVNAGLVEHELVLGDKEFQAAWAAADAAATPPGPFATAPPASVAPAGSGIRIVLASGASTVVDYEVPTSVGVELFCHLPGHAERGMIGRVLLVTP